MTCTVGATLGISSGYHSYKEHRAEVEAYEQQRFEDAVATEVRNRLWKICESKSEHILTYRRRTSISPVTMWEQRCREDLYEISKS